MVPPASTVRIRELLEIFHKFSYYYGRKVGGEEGEAAQPQRLSCRVASKPVAQAKRA
jgi:hypothetical protein